MEAGLLTVLDSLQHRWECAEKNYTWVNSKITFDHVGHAYLALFQVVSTLQLLPPVLIHMQMQICQTTPN